MFNILFINFYFMLKKYAFLMVAIVTMFGLMPFASANSNGITINEFKQELSLDKQISTAIVSGGGYGMENVMMNESIGNYVSISFSLTTEAVAGLISIDGTYSTTGETREEVYASLNDMYKTIKSKLEPYGKVRKGYMNVWDGGCIMYKDDGTCDSSTFSGDLQINITLNDSTDLTTVEEILNNNSFSNYWINVEVDEEAKIDAEVALIDKIKKLLGKKIDLYEKLLDQDFVSISSLSIDAWPDGYKYDADTNKVPLIINVYASATFE